MNHFRCIVQGNALPRCSSFCHLKYFFRKNLKCLLRTQTRNQTKSRKSLVANILFCCQYASAAAAAAAALCPPYAGLAALAARCRSSSIADLRLKARRHAAALAASTARVSPPLLPTPATMPADT